MEIDENLLGQLSDFLNTQEGANLLDSLNNNNNCIIYITVCDENNVYYIIIKGVPSLSSTSFKCPSIYNQHNNYLIDIEITNIDCYQEKRSRI